MKKMLFSLVIILIFSILVSQLSGVAAAQNAGISQQSKVQVIISFVSKASEGDKIGTMASVDGEVKHRYSIINGMAALVSPSKIGELQKNPLVARVDQDVEVKALDINADKQIGADQVWITGDAGEGVPVAVLDTGIDNSHPEFSGRILKCHSEITNTDTCNDQNGHGTHTAGIVGAAGNLGTSSSAMAKGVAPNISLYIDQVLDASGSGSIAGLIAGIDWATANGAKVISMSLGTGTVVTTQPNCDADIYGFSTLRDAINNATAHGVTVVAAAGNSGPGQGVGAPACIASTIAVGAVDSTDTIAYFSSRGGPIADHGIAAPGVNIFSTLPGGYGILSGTSMATPVVSGTVALMIKANSSLSPTSSTNQPIRSILFNTACNQGTNPSCPTGAVPNTVYGYGRVDALKAYNAAVLNAPNYYNLSGYITNKSSGLPLNSALVQTNKGMSTTTDAAGFYKFALSNGTYTVSASLAGYVSNSTTVAISGSEVTNANISLSPALPLLSIKVITDRSRYSRGYTVKINTTVTSSGIAVPGATVGVTILDPVGTTVSTKSGITDTSGTARFTYVIPTSARSGTYTIKANASAAGYTSGSGSTTFRVR